MWGYDVQIDYSEPERMLATLDRVLEGQRLMMFHETITQEWLRHRARDRFTKEGGPEVGGQWAELTESRGDIREHAGFPREHPINHAEGELEDFITGGANEFTFGAEWATFFMPGRTRSKSLTGKMERAQRGAPAGHPMPVGGRGAGTKASPSPTPPRPVVGMDAVDMVHLTTSLMLWVEEEVIKSV